MQLWETVGEIKGFASHVAEGLAASLDGAVPQGPAESQVRWPRCQEPWSPHGAECGG